MRTRPLALLLSMAALSAGLVACGGEDEESSSAPATTQQAAPQQMPADENIVGLAQGQRDLSTLVTAVTTADLAKTLQGKGPYTVFAPTNEAFAAVGKSTLDDLLAPAGKQQLTDVLTYHVVAGEVKAADLRDGQRLKTVEGGTLRVAVDGDRVTVGGATVVQPDVEASNGVVHVIDTVLLPQA
ncbi:MAG TPA: fasciclin domain-containing protein [Solirubrobacteraceae bacterium]|nr:fasciclin domain-containing protein [Solirubrobacteraceae bacterium]